MPTFEGYPADTRKFLAALKKNNDREWFNERKPRYEESVVEPSLQLIEALQKPLKSFSPMFMAVPKKSGGSLMRIYRDTRFSKDKVPYKTNIGIHIRHEFGKNVHAPGLYIHIEPKEVFLGAGIWHPEPKVAKQIRVAIDEDQTAWKRATRGKAFKEEFHLAGDSLKRPPRDFDADHSLVEDLMRKDFIAVRDVEPKEIESRDFQKQIEASFRKAKPLMKFLCGALALPF